ncbi:MAG: hypothetical protein PHT07_14995 [Paludibacter sp.]|nr:hypothetical protein [Paludibacter sp.]
MITRIAKILRQLLYKYTAKYHIVAYNNRMYSGYRYVNDSTYTWISAEFWLDKHADRSRYVYDLFDIKKGQLVYDYTEMVQDFESVKNIILNINAYHEDTARKMIFNFKSKWTRIAGYQAASLYFSDLMTIYNTQMQKFNTPVS